MLSMHSLAFGISPVDSNQLNPIVAFAPTAASGWGCICDSQCCCSSVGPQQYSVYTSQPCKCSLCHADWTIALASTQMVRALFPNRSAKLRALNAASWALMPFQPTAVSTANFGIAEVGNITSFALYACQGPCAVPVARLFSQVLAAKTIA